MTNYSLLHRLLFFCIITAQSLWRKFVKSKHIQFSSKNLFKIVPIVSLYYLII